MAALNHRFFHGDGNINIDIDLADDGPDDLYISEVRLHLVAVGGANTLTINVDSTEGEFYDSILSSQDMTAVANKIFALGELVRAQDHLTIKWTNASAIVWGIELITRPATEWD